jgi:hypothetical protein
MQIPLEIKESGRKHVTDDKREEECTIRFWGQKSKVQSTVRTIGVSYCNRNVHIMTLSRVSTEFRQHGIPYIFLLPYIPFVIRNCRKFRGIIRNYVSRNAAEFRGIPRNFALHRISHDWVVTNRSSKKAVKKTLTRVKTKIFVFIFSRKFCKNHTKITKIFAKIFAKNDAKIFAKTKIEAKIFAKTKITTNTYAKILLFGILIFWPDFFTIFWQKFRDNFCEN